MATRLNVNKVLADLIESATDARAHYQIWWALRDLINSAVAVVEYLRRANGRTSGVFESDRYARATLGLIEALKK